jgi:hypothetical protein
VLTIPSISKEYLSVPVSGTGLAGTEPVEIAVVPAGTEEPAEDDWLPAVWASGQARILIGPGGDVELADGVYEVWVRVTASPEVPVLKSGLLRIT